MKNIFDYSHVKSVRAIALIDMKTNKPCGKIIANFSDNPNGSVCTAQVIIHNPKDYGIAPKREAIHLYEDKYCEQDKNLIGRAGGGGYDKLSAAISYALRDNTTECPTQSFDGCGLSAAQTWFESLGITFFEVC